jgi:CcmD family protein
MEDKMLFQDAPAATTGYMVAGYGVILSVIVLYLLSLVIRQNNLKKDLEVLQEEQAQTDAAAG